MKQISGLIPASVRQSLSVKFSLAFTLLLVGVTLIVLFIVNNAVKHKFISQYQNDVSASVQTVRNEFQTLHNQIGERLAILASRLLQDNQFRIQAAVLKDEYHPYVVNYARDYMSSAGLQALEILKTDGTVLSSGHYRNAFGTQDSTILENLKRVRETLVFAGLSRATGEFICLVQLDSVSLGSTQFYLLGGIEITPALLENVQPIPTEIVAAKTREATMLPTTIPTDQSNLVQIIQESFRQNESSVLNNRFSVGEFRSPALTSQGIDSLTVLLLHPTTELASLLTTLRRQIFFIGLFAVIIAVGISIWRTNRITRPLKELSNTASQLSLDNLDIQFNVDSDDEVGVLNDALQHMVRRLRASRIQLTQAEKKASMADIVRQVNHDIKNGFIPIRNVMQHWLEVEEKNPEAFVQIFSERKSTILESLDYLESLTKDYSKLQPELNYESLDIHLIIRNLVNTYQDLPGKAIRIIPELDASRYQVTADKIQLRRAFENILINAIDAIQSQGSIRITSHNQNDQLVIRWIDDGMGIPEKIQERLFYENVTTKSRGSGLGLSNVRRIIRDFNGLIRLESDEGSGTVVTTILPVTGDSSHN